MTLTAVRLIAPVLWDTGDESLLDKICGKTTREVDRIAAGIRPRKECAEKVTVGTKEVLPIPLAFGFGSANAVADAGSVRVAPKKAAEATYITPTRVKVEFSAREELVEKLERAKAVAKVLTVEEVLKRALEEYLERHDPARKAARNVGKAAKGVGDGKDAARAPAEAAMNGIGGESLRPEARCVTPLRWRAACGRTL